MKFKDLIIFLASFAVYLNAIPCGFVFDDASAIKENQDLRPTTHWTELFQNDFWGTPMQQERSHKSYRPVTVWTFRLNYMFHELQPSGYHLINVLLHSVVCVLFHRLILRFLPEESALVTSLFFALHPVHTEAVTGVVGRAELLSACVSLVSMFIFISVRSSSSVRYWIGVLCLGLLIGLGTLCKEQCITIIGVFGAYEVMIHYTDASLSLFKTNGNDATDERNSNKSTPKFALTQMLKQSAMTLQRILKVLRAALTNLLKSRSICTLLALILSACAIMYGRVLIMGAQLPHFTEFDNPAAHAPPLIRRLTHLYLIPINLLLLLYPSGLCADWTVGSLRLVEQWTDPRNCLTVLAFGWLFLMAILALIPRKSSHYPRTLVLALSFMVFPFLPASNLFFPVGFVVAERVLYTPSLGFSLLFGLGYEHAVFGQSGTGPAIASTPRKVANHHMGFQSARRKWFIRVSVSIVLAAFALKTVRRNFDWINEYNLFSSALKVNPNNAKMWNNVGHALEAEGRFQEALGYFRKAVSVQPNDIGARINVGRTYVNLRMPDKAEEAYYGALDYFPKPRKGKVYYTRVAPKDLMVFINLANLYLNKSPPQLEEAAQLLRRAISLRSDFVDAYQNYGSVLIKQRKLEEAETAYRAAITYQEKNPDLHYNLGVVLLDTGRKSDGVSALNRALFLKPDHLPSLFALATTFTDSTDHAQREKGTEILRSLASKDFESAKVHFALAMIETDNKQFRTAVEHYRTVIEHEPTHRSALFNLALLLRNELQDPDGALPILQKLIEHHPDHVKSYLLLGDIELTEKKNAKRAKQLFEKASNLAPDNVQAKHNLCVALADDGDLSASEQCLLEAIKMAPNEVYLREHLAIVRKRLSPN